MFKVFNLIMILMFVISAGLQYNDPDLARWMAIYTAAAIVSITEGKPGKTGVVVSLVVALAAIAWAVAIGHGMTRSVTVPELFKRMDVHQPQIEEGREIGGLLIVAAWMVVLAVRNRARSRARSRARISTK